jgi:hypothetical protein
VNRCRIGRGSITTLAVAAVIASCGGGESGPDAAPDSSAAATDSAPAAPTTDDDATATEATEADSDDAAESGSTTNCDAIFSMAEMEEFFAEPVELTEETDDSLGRLLCVWESIEDPDDMDDLAFKVMTVQVFSGSPVDASSFIDPSIFESVVTIEGVGDLAYSSDLLEADFYFLDDPIGGALSYSEVDMGDPDAPRLNDRDAVEQLFRTFHERVT